MEIEELLKKPSVQIQADGGHMARGIEVKYAHRNEDR